MPRASHATAPIEADYGIASERTAHLDGYTVQFVSIHADNDLAPMLQGLPDDACQCPHWGYVLSGELTVRYTTGEVEQITSGDAFYMSPGHAPSAAACVGPCASEISRIDERAAAGSNLCHEPVVLASPRVAQRICERE